MIDCLRSGCIF